MEASLDMEKVSEMSPDRKAMFSKYLKKGIGAGVLSAAVGLAISRIKSKRKMESYNPMESKDAIVIDINKDNFLKDVMTPEDQAKMVLASKPKETSSGAATATMSENDIAALKKDILRKNERKMSFFGSKAASDSGDDKQGDESDKDKGKVPGDSGVNEAKAQGEGEKDKDKTVLPRDSEGRFVSPTNPTGVLPVEKSAEYEWMNSLKNLFVHPIDTASGVWNSATTRPLAMAGGMVTSMVLSAMIIDKVNELRAKASKKTTDDARKEYVRKLQGSEKEAKYDPSFSDTKSPVSAIGTVMGSAFFIPAVLSAIIVNRVMTRRREKMERADGASSSYAREPIILYRTIDGKEKEISPETAMASMAVKKAMMDSGVDFGGKMSKSAYDYESASSRALEMLNDPNNQDNFLNTMRGYTSGDMDAAKKSFGNMLGWKDKVFGPYGNEDFQKRFLADPRFHDLVINRFEDPNYADTFGAYRRELVDNELGKTFKKGGFLHKIMSWLYNNLGLWKGKVRTSLYNMSRPSPQVAAGTQGAAAQTA